MPATAGGRRNRLNNLDSKTWLKFQKSWFVHNPPPRRKDVLTHPAKFPETLAEEFIRFFTKRGQTVLDPMVGTGSTLVACVRARRRGVGIELNERYYGIAEKIVADEVAATARFSSRLTPLLFNADASDIGSLRLPKIDYVLTCYDDQTELLTGRRMGTVPNCRKAWGLRRLGGRQPPHT